jgi:hypothetical protein
MDKVPPSGVIEGACAHGAIFGKWITGGLSLKTEPIDVFAYFHKLPAWRDYHHVDDSLPVASADRGAPNVLNDGITQLAAKTFDQNGCSGNQTCVLWLAACGTRLVRKNFDRRLFHGACRVLALLISHGRLLNASKRAVA